MEEKHGRPSYSSDGSWLVPGAETILLFASETGGSLLCGLRKNATVKKHVQPSCILGNGTGHIPPFSTSKGICFSRKNFPIASAVRDSYVPPLSFEIIFSIWTWTYRVFDKPKVIIMGNSYGVLGYGVLETLLFWGPLSTLKAKSHVQADEPPQYSPKFRRLGRDTGMRSSQYLLRLLAYKDYILSVHLELVSLVSHRLCDCRGHQEGVLPQLGLFGSGSGRALLGSL